MRGNLHRGPAARAAVLGLAAVLAAGGAWAQPAARPSGGAAGGAAGVAAQGALDATRAAWAVERTALLDLRLAEAPTEADYRIADLALEIAQAMSPGRADIVRRRIEASWNAGRTDAAFDLTKELIRLDPSDTVAQLRLISGTIGKKQTAPERLAMYRRFTTSKLIDASVRSRLATDAALLSRETGDGAGFRDYLKIATSLDSTNKDAAVVAYSTYNEEHPDDAPGRLELLSNLLMADPLDPMVHLTIATELGKHGCFEQANRMHGLGRALLRKTGGEITQTNEVEALVLEWQVNGPAKVLARINSNLAQQRRSIAEYNASVRDSGIGIGKDVGEADDLRLGADTEKVRLATAIASENADGAKASLQDMTRSADYMMTLATDDGKRPLGITREEALGQAQAAAMDLQFWRVMSGLDLDKVEDSLKTLEDPAREEQVGPDIVRAILKLRQQDAAAALTMLDALIAKLPEGKLVRYTAEYARGQALELLGRKDEAIASYRQVQRGAPLRPIGAVARFRLEKLLGGRDEFSPDRPALQKIAEGIPPFVDEMIEHPKSFMAVLGETPVKGSFGDDAPLTLRVRNISPIPLALGSDRPINSRIMLSPTLTGRASRLGPLMRPEIIELDQRLRLDTRETLRVDVHPDLGYPGFVLDLACDAQARYSWKILQGFTPGKSGNFGAGPLSLAAESSTVNKPPLPETKLSASELATRLGSDTGEELFRSLMAARQRLWIQLLADDLAKPETAATETPAPTTTPPSPTPTPPAPSTPAASTPAAAPATGAQPAGTPAKPEAATPASTEAPKPTVDLAAERSAIAGALAARFASLSVPQRLLVAAMMPHAGQVAETAALDAAILADPDVSVRMLGLITRVPQSDAPVLQEALKSPDPRLAELAQLLSERLSKTGPCYARLTGGLRKLRGLTETPNQPE